MRILLRRYSTPMCAMFRKLCQIWLMPNLVTADLIKNEFTANATAECGVCNSIAISKALGLQPSFSLPARLCALHPMLKTGAAKASTALTNATTAATDFSFSLAGGIKLDNFVSTDRE